MERGFFYKPRQHSTAELLNQCAACAGFAYAGKTKPCHREQVRVTCERVGTISLPSLVETQETCNVVWHL